ncbi:MAG TPA: hypothetical protein DCM67_00550 [Propionibacteriaceae bacterium]|nr:hypothetical protein [Propionibacteriaceae bacterium]
MAGVQHCKSVWACPMCSAQILVGRAVRLQGVVDGWHAEGKRVGFLTLTLRHTAKMSITDVWDKLMKAWAKTQGSSWSSLVKGTKTQAGIGVHFAGGRVAVPICRTVEVSRGDHGWHPHLHLLIFVRDEDAWNRVVSFLVPRWVDCVRAVGARVDADKCIDAELVDPSTDSAERVASYLAKSVFDGSGSHSAIHWEMAGGLGKAGRRGSRTPFQILADAEAGDVRSAALWHEFEVGSRGRRQMSIPPILLDRYGFRDATDAEEFDAADERAQDWLPGNRPL